MGQFCDELPASCLACQYNHFCTYGKDVEVVCRPKDNVICMGRRNFSKTYKCLFCYQTPAKYHNCTVSTACRVNTFPKQRYQANCTVDKNIFCIGRRKFLKMRDCNWTSGRRWRTAFILSITLGGLGIDRFYLGLWKEGLGKLFSFGGVGVWTLIDILLIASGYLTPADGSLYI
ncbi:hypothetical protein HELRODRAFT_156173 [Helobdella robusta]|uniref:TM2 domain-containing protein n=1 Tax=Helobdella robusta TaxID=6412 RepID=T1ELS2_HELRO|nr:hypothetical protein HELRODRAFT_156173 [Helobdella robusta]ESN90535.1 hypothetical protein HELRODRAFT_156173 [Helobdella robusta]